MKVLIVDDDLALSDVVSFTMSRAGYEVIVAHDGLTTLERWSTEQPDLIILDLNLPRLDGLAVCRKIRAASDTPIIILSVRGGEEDVVRGLKLGADDYVVKPFSPMQLVARCEAVLRRAGSSPVKPSPIEAGLLSLDPTRCEVHYGGRYLVRLTKLECRLLDVLMRNRDHVLPADYLIDYVWGPEGGDRGMLKQLVYRLRRKFDAEASVSNSLETVMGVGYSFTTPVSET
ncbi:MAG: response regulator [Anaerolineales bacterium]|nr:response regulator [Anaerolineales bacterium]